jgi:hypothetical protein
MMMMNWLKTTLAAGAVLLLIGGAQAANAESFELPVALFVKSAAQGYGMYEVRQTNHFKVGETINFYIQPLNFKYKEEKDSMYSFGMSADLILVSKGEVLFGKTDFMNLNFNSHVKNKELMLNGHLDVTGAPPGEYTIELLVRDHVSKELAKTKMDFVID